MLLTTVYYRTSLTFGQVALLLGVSRSAANRVVAQVVPQVVIDANTRRHVAVGNTTPGDRHDSRVYRDSDVDQQCAGVHVMADGGYSGNPGVIIPYREP